MTTVHAVRVRRGALRFLVFAVAFCGACNDSSRSAGQGATPGTSGQSATFGTNALALRPAPGVSHADWLGDWQTKLLLTVALRKGEHQGEVQGANYSRDKVQYPVYQATLSVQNNTGHTLETARALYLIQSSATGAAAPTAKPKSALKVIGGQFREAPAEDYAGAVELRGAKLTPDMELGLIDSIDADARRGFFGGIVDVFLSLLGSGGNRLDRRYESEKDFGRAATGQTLVIETNDLQMTVRVQADREGSLYLISPWLVFRDAQGAASSFRFIATFDRGAETPSLVTLLAIDEETWTGMVGDAQLPLWKRMLAVESLGSVVSPTATAALTSLADPANSQPRPLREAALHALSTRPEGTSLATTIAINRKEPWQVRRAAVVGLGRSKDPAVTATLEKLLDDSENRVRGSAIDGLAERGDKDAVSSLVALLSRREASDVRFNAASAIAKLGDESIVQSLATLGTKSGDLRRTLIPILTKLGGASSLPTLEAWFTATLPKGKEDKDWPVRIDVCTQLAGRDDPASASLLRRGLADPHDSVRSAAIQAMSRPLNPERETLLISLMSDGNAQTSRAAIRALGAATSSAAKSKLLDMVKTPSLAKEIRWAALEGLGNYGEADVAQALVATLASEADANLRADTYSALAKHPTPQALVAIERGLLDTSSYSAERAAWILRKQRGTKACAPTLSALIARQDGEAADELVGTLTLPGCRDRVSFDKVIARLGASDAAYDKALTRLLKSWSGQDAGTDKTKWTAAWK